MSDLIRERINQQTGVDTRIETGADAGNEIRVLDGDTFRTTIDGKVQDVRINGIDTLETAKVWDDPDNPVKMGQWAAEEQTEILAKLMKDGNYKTPVLTGERSHGKGKHRVIGDFENDEGRSYRRDAIYYGLSDLSGYATPDDEALALRGTLDYHGRKSRGELNEWDIASEKLRELRGQLGVVARPLAATEEQLAAAQGDERLKDFYSPTDVQIRHTDRHLDNTAKSITASSIDYASVAFPESIYGAFDFISDVFNEDTYNWGERNRNRLEQDKIDLPYRPNQSAFDAEGNWSLDGVAEYTNFLIGNAIVSAPYLLNTMVATALAPVTFGASLAAPVLVYAGDTYNEQLENDNVNYGLVVLSGIGQAAFDILGIKGLGKTALWSSETRKKAVKETAKKFGVTDDVANSMLAGAVKREWVNWSDAAKQHLKIQMRTTKQLGRAGLNVSKGATSEAITEAIQETIGYTAAVHPDKWNQADYKNRIVTAAIAGGSLGGAFSGVGAAYEAGSIADAVKSNERGHLDTASRDLALRKKLVDENPNIQSVDDLLDALEKNDFAALGFESEAAWEDATFSDVAADRRAERAKRRLPQKISDFVFETGLKGLVYGNRDHILDPFINDKNTYMNYIAALYGSANALNGVNDETARQVLENELNSVIDYETDSVNKFKRDAKGTKIKNSKDVSKVILDRDSKSYIRQLYNAVQRGAFATLQAAHASGKFTYEGQYGDVLTQTVELNSQLIERERIRNQGNGAKDADHLAYMNRKSFVKRAIENDRPGFVQVLINKHGFKAKDAEKFVNDIVDLNDINLPEDQFNVDLRTSLPTSLDDLRQDGEPLTKKEFIQSLQEDADLAKFFDDNIFYNTAADSASVATGVTNSRYFGNGGSNIVKLLNLAEAKGEITAEEKALLADKLLEDQELHTGEYGRIENETWKWVQRNLIFVVAIASLPLATLSALVELTLVTRQLTPQQIFKQIMPAAKELSSELLNAGQDTVSLTGISTGGTTRTRGQQELYKHGWLSDRQAARRRIDVSTGHSQQKWLDAYFRTTFLQGITNFTRNLRLAMAQDAMRGWVNEIYQDRMVDGVYDPNAPMTQAATSAYENLVNMGSDPEFLVELQNREISGGAYLPTEEEAARFEKELNHFSHNFVNAAIANPTKGNRPKFYNDPRWALIFQFQGYISTFTANILGPIYKQTFGKNKTIADRFGGAANIGMLLLVGFLSQMLRDEIKYGKTSPYLEDWEFAQRALYSSGLLGTGERIFDIVNPLYEQQARGVGGYVEAAFRDAAPAAGYSISAVKAGKGILEGEPSAKELIKLTPGRPLHTRFKHGDSPTDVIKEIFNG